ncbi:MAG TPA: SGNH/GDSL hydrolase family protein, partial [bacterium]|nr:SGNH/GDSL hydrolase family protein [bacterium]
SLCFVNLLFQNNAAVYPTDVGMDLSTKYPGIQLLNLAIPGATSMTVINNEMSSIPQGAASPTFVTILIGGNELITTCGNSPGVGSPCDGGIFGCTTAQGATWASNFQARLETQIVDVLKNTALYPRVQKIVIANIYDPTDGVGLAAYGWPAGEAVLAQYNTAIQNVVNDTGSTLVDDYTLFLGHGIQYNIISNPYYDSANPTFWYTPNGASLPIHPNNTGYFELYKLFWPDF